MREYHSYSALLHNAVEAFSSLPGIGRKSAMRHALFLLRQEPEFTHDLVNTLTDFVDGVQYCERCHCICDGPLCSICRDGSRDEKVICVVENIQDLMAIEQTGEYKGLYHVLGGTISLIEQIGPEQLHIADLPKRVEDEGVEEVILALSTTSDGNTTNFYIYDRLREVSRELRISLIARGVALGDKLEYADELTLGQSIQNRIDFASTLAVE